MAVLGIDQHERIRRNFSACVAQGYTRPVPAACPHIHGWGFIAGLYHWLGQIELAIELQRAGLNSHGTRSFTRPTALVDDPYADALPVEPKSKNQPGRAGSDNEYVGL